MILCSDSFFFSYQHAFWMSIALGRIVLDLSSYNNNNKTSQVSLHLFFLQEVYVFNSMVFCFALYNVCIREVFVWAITGVKHIFFCIQFNLHLKCIPLSLFLCSVPKKQSYIYNIISWVVGNSFRLSKQSQCITVFLKIICLLIVLLIH